MSADNDGTANTPTHNSAGRTPIKPFAPKLCILPRKPSTSRCFTDVHAKMIRAVLA